MYGFLADLMVAIHVGYVGYVVVGQLVIWLGWAMRRQFVRNFWFRATHLLAIAVVAYEELMDIRCPLSVWEEYFRHKAGQDFSGETFLGRMLHSLLFYDFDKSTFDAIYYTTLAVVLLTLVFCRPRLPFRKKQSLTRASGAALAVR
jgi:hypothetical protein